MNIQIQILNPEVRGILDQLAKLNLIKIENQEETNLFSELLTRIRSNTGEEKTLSLEEITDEVESVRQQRFEQNKKQD